MESALWKTQRDLKSVLSRAIGEAAASAQASPGELAVVLTNDSAIRLLNRQWRGKDAPTNVLSFPMQSGPTPGVKGRGARPLLGDIVIAYETTAREARAGRIPFRHHLAHLVVHGFLHLTGRDHETDDEANAMEALEVEILARLGIPNPYITRGGRPR